MNSRIQAAADSALAFTREDFAVLAADFRRQMRGPSDKLGAIGVIAGLGVGAGLVSLATARGWPGYMQPVFFFFGWTLALVPVAWWRRRQWRLLRTSGLLCSGCGKPLVDTWRNTGRGETVLADGVCPSCAHPVFLPDAVDSPVSRQEMRD